MSDLHRIIGKDVAKVELDQTKRYLRFTFKDATSLCWMADGDCCSQSWFESVESFNFLGYGSHVERVDCLDGPEREGGELKIYFCTVYAAGRLCIEMRNSSNGYYGGSIEVGETPEMAWDDNAGRQIPLVWREVTDAV